MAEYTTTNGAFTRLRHLFIVMSVAAITAVGFAATAGADPVRHGEVLDVECTGGLEGSLTIATNGNGQWTPGLVTTNTQLGVPYAFLFEGTFTPTGGEPQPFSDYTEKPQPKNGRYAVCTFHEDGVDEEGAFSADGTVWISYTPAHP